MTRESGGAGKPASSTDATDADPAGADSAGSADGCILVADDNEDCRVALCTLLESLGYRVLEASDGESAVEVARHEEPDLILMDIMMPGVDGLEATRQIRASSDEGQMRIVAVSAMEGARQASLAAGCDDCILKPIDLKDLDDLVAGWMP
jgi:CheY-like chemotaxis protein